MKKLIVTSDLSPESKRAFPLAREIAQALGASVTLLAVVEDPTRAAFAYAMDCPVYPDPAIHAQVLSKVRSDIEALKTENFTGMKAESIVLESLGSVAVEICSYAKKEGASMIVLSSHGRSGLTRLLIGSVAERVIRESPCPVLVVPNRA